MGFSKAMREEKQKKIMPKGTQRRSETIFCQLKSPNEAESKLSLAGGKWGVLELGTYHQGLDDFFFLQKGRFQYEGSGNSISNSHIYLSLRLARAVVTRTHAAGS